tara:strand:- start:1281 stop:4169 length:2889 start_codon:yes stop_codon:yes gene_type:complete
MTYRKKLIEVSLPLEALNKALGIENSKRHGKMSTIHPYWARRPQSSCRTLLWATLVDDPSSWPEIFKTSDDILEERKRLYAILIELAQWDNMNDKIILYRAKYEIARSIARRKNLDIQHISDLSDNPGISFTPHENRLNKWLSDNGPSVHDPFCGGGSIPLEAFRLGMNAVATDLNPLAIMITKATVEIPSRFTSQRLSKLDNTKNIPTKISQDLQTFGQRLIDLCDDELSPQYPKFKVTKDVIKKDPHLRDYLGQELTVLTWLWARTFPTSDPAYRGAQVPTVRSQCLSKKKGYYVEIDIDGDSYDFRVVGPNATPPNINGNDGTMKKTGAVCLFSGTLLPFSYLREQAVSGKMGKKMMAIVLEGKKGRLYASPTEEETEKAQIEGDIDKPTTNLPKSALGFSVQNYGLDKHWKLFESRQLKAISTLYSKLDGLKEEIIREMTEVRGWTKGEQYQKEGSDALAYSEAIVTLIAMTISKLSDLSCNLSRWESKAEAVQQLFARQTVSMVWDFAESNILSKSRGSYYRALKSTSGYFEKYLETISGSPALVYQQDAASISPKKETVFFTDPPYYDNIGYADLSDFFYTWLNKYLRGIHSSVFSTILTPKTEELVATPKRNGTKDEAAQFFLSGMTSVINNLSNVGSEEYPLSFYYAFKQSEVKDGMRSSRGWVTFLQSIIDSGLEVIRTFPSRTEHAARLITMGKAGLSTNVILVCRSRKSSKSIRRNEFISEIKAVLYSSINEMQESGISPIDLTQAAIGPGISVYSRYASILEVDGSKMGVRSALEIINNELSKVLEETDYELDSGSKVCLKWFLVNGFSPAPYGDLDNLLRSTTSSSEIIEKSGCIVISNGKVRIAEIDSYAGSFSSKDMFEVPAWAHVHKLIRILNVSGEGEAAAYMRLIPSDQRDSVRSLTYRLYQICEEKKMIEQAKHYNSLAISWGQVSDRLLKPVVLTQVTLDEY